MLWVSAVLFAGAAFTDWLDGFLARQLGQGTAFGAFLDPVADKLIVVTALVLLIAYILLAVGIMFSMPSIIYSMGGV